MLAEALESALEGSEIGLTIPEHRQLTKETRKFCQISRESLPTLCRSLVLPAPMGQQPWDSALRCFCSWRSAFQAAGPVDTHPAEATQKVGSLLVVVGGGSKARPRTVCSQLFLPCPSDTTSLGKLLQTNQGHDPPLNLPSNWEGQMYPRDLMRENVSRNVCKCWNRGQMY